RGPRLPRSRDPGRSTPHRLPLLRPRRLSPGDRADPGHPAQPRCAYRRTDRTRRCAHRRGFAGRSDQAGRGGHLVNESPRLVLVVGALVAVGVVLLRERSLTRVLLGFVVMSNGANLMILAAGGAAGGPPVLWFTQEGKMTDPLPQAMILTAIVITLGLTAFLL